MRFHHQIRNRLIETGEEETRFALPVIKCLLTFKYNYDSCCTEWNPLYKRKAIYLYVYIKINIDIKETES